MNFDLNQALCWVTEQSELKGYIQQVGSACCAARWSLDSTGTVVLQEIDYVEYFAGFGRITSYMKCAMYRAARFDILDHTPTGNQKTNFMDLNSASGYAFP